MSTVKTEFDEMQEIIGDFLIEADELINSLDANLITLEEKPDDLDLLNEIFRAAHTIKGTSGFLGLETIMSLTHKMEDVLNKLRKGTLKVTSQIMDVLLESVDMLKILIEDVSEKRDVERDITGVVARLTAISEGKSPESETDSASSEPAADEKSDGKDIGADDSPKEESGNNAGSTEKTASTNNLNGAKKHKDQTIRVDVKRLDTLMNLMGELVLSRNSLMQSRNVFIKEHESLSGVEELTRSTTQVSFITSELQDAVMKMRMLPIGKVFGKFPRVVRDLSRESGKKISLEIFGEETELDKSLIEEIGDPLVHLIRNSCDHGIEAEEDRIAAGKSGIGTIRLGASQEGSNIVITIEDDGKGLDIAAIKTKAIERGLATEESVARMTDKEIFRFIFNPGFSTAKVITDVSGRGVGMDVVRTNIEKLKGIIDVESTKGVGSKISLKIPLTLAIIQGLLIVSEGETFIVPLASVLEIRRITREDIESVNQRDVIILRDGVLPIVNLNRLLKGNTRDNGENDHPYIVIVGLAEKRLGLIIDELIGQEEVVIKTMGEMLGVTDGVAGATILGDGRVRLIIDLIGLFNLAGN